MTTSSTIRFAEVQEPSPWLEFISQHFALQSDAIHGLLDFGAIYVNHKRWHPEPDEILKPKDIVRVHISPRRFPVEKLQSSCIQAVEKDWILIWKPSSLPSHETLDNLLENCKAWLERERGEKLWSLSRLDVGTRGWLIFSRTADFARDYNISLQERRVSKFYETLSPQPRLPVGRWRHWMQKSLRAPKFVSSSPDETFTLACELNVDWMNFSKACVHSRLNLITGRTHQIRSQFAFEGAPLLGDTLYNSEFPSPSKTRAEEFALSCESFSFEHQNRIWAFDRPASIPSLPEMWLNRDRDEALLPPRKDPAL